MSHTAVIVVPGSVAPDLIRSNFGWKDNLARNEQIGTSGSAIHTPTLSSLEVKHSTWCVIMQIAGHRRAVARAKAPVQVGTRQCVSCLFVFPMNHLIIYSYIFHTFYSFYDLPPILVSFVLLRICHVVYTKYLSMKLRTAAVVSDEVSRYHIFSSQPHRWSAGSSSKERRTHIDVFFF